MPPHEGEAPDVPAHALVVQVQDVGLAEDLLAAGEGVPARPLLPKRKKNLRKRDVQGEEEARANLTAASLEGENLDLVREGRWEVPNVAAANPGEASPANAASLTTVVHQYHQPDAGEGVH